MPSISPTVWEKERFRAYGPRHVDEIADRFEIPDHIARSIRTLSSVLPFRVNEYVLSQLVDWDNIPQDPIFQMVFPQSGMLTHDDEQRLAPLVDDPSRKKELRLAVQQIRSGLNPHPSGQKQLNVPTLDGDQVPGLQHKYRETVLYFPGQGQTCHSYCTYCFRWAQFVGDADLRFAAPEPSGLVEYLGRHPEVDDVLVTGGDPMIMSTDRLRGHLEPILGVPTVRTIRIGTKSVAYWPQRFTTDADADDVLRLFEQVVASGRNLAVMMHFTHPRELETDLARRAVARIRSTGALAYCQAPMVAHVNDDAEAWSTLWRAELAAGAVPYYVFVERDTGPYDYFKVPLARAHEIFRTAYRTLPGLARTVRGPVMSATPGKVLVDGIEETAQGRFFQLRMLQARDPRLVGRPFRAHYSETAAWLDDLRLAADTPADIAAAVKGSLPTFPAHLDDRLLDQELQEELAHA
ncbi:L-lysine 2,3-aminomutase [Streptomyces sp. ADI96-02]|uniref:KamA family radical SAM protein n=1 Tax=unclassified Streptomyces TaxID=2593676 RepID=UPI000F55358D|nr:lysine 2,3-aminomutase [Streptomyces sp. ADI96-02]RPK65827.1 L-lysine 2,3-aminomutase [Streptomyces sp. ADI96-02]